MKFVVVECLSKECLDVFNTTTTICAHDGQILAIALVAMAVTVAGFVRHCALPLFGGMSVDAQDRYRRWREYEEAEKERLLAKINQRPPDAYP